MFRYLSSVGFPLAIFAALAALSLWLRHAIEMPDGGRDGKRRHDPDYIIHDFRVLKLSPAGKPHHNLQAAKLTHYPDDDSTIIDLPRFSYVAPAKPNGNPAPVAIQSKRALVSTDGTVVVLHGNVVVLRAAGGGRGALRGETESLTLFPDQERAVTDSPVLLTEGAARLHGTGMDLDQKAQTFVLRSQVTGSFPPKQGSSQ